MRLVIRAWANYLRERIETWAANTVTDAFATDD